MAIVCICNNFNDQAVEKAINSRDPAHLSVDDWEDIYFDCSDLEPIGCGTCVEVIREKIVSRIQSHLKASMDNM